MSWSRIVRLVALIAAIAVYLGARFWNIGATCLWFDEIFSVHAAEHGWNTILQFVALDLIHPPLFYLLLKVWISAGGESLVWLRSFPILFSIAAILPFLLLCRELRLRRGTTLLGLFFLAVNGSLIKYAQEVRMYSMLLCLSLFSFWLFTRYFQNRNRAIFLAVVNILLVYTHYFGWLVVISEMMAILVYQRTKLRQTSLMFLGVLASFVPWLLAIFAAAGASSGLGQNIGWMSRPGPAEIGQLVLNLVEPFYYSAISIDPVSIYRVSVPLLLLAVISLASYFAKFGISSEEQTVSSKLLIIFTVIPLVLVFVASWILPYSIWGTRHLIIVFAPATMLFANTVLCVRSLKIRTFALTILLLFIGYAFILQVNRQPGPAIWCGLGPMGEEIHADAKGPFIVFEDLTAYQLWFEFRKENPKPSVIKLKDFPGMPEDTAYFLPRGFDEVRQMSADELKYDQIWVVYRSTDYDQFSPPLYSLGEEGYEIIDHRVRDFGYQKLIAVLLRRKRSAGGL